MVLKIFVKRLPGGQLLNDKLAWTEELIEGKSVLISPTTKGHNYTVTHGDVSPTGFIPSETHGFELLNDAGVTIYKHVTSITEQQFESCKQNKYSTQE